LLTLRDQLIEAGPLPDIEMRVEYARFLSDVSRIALQLGKREEADQYLREATRRLEALVAEQPGYRFSKNALASVWMDYWFRHGELPGPSAVTMLSGYLDNPAEATSCNDASLAAKLEIMRGNKNLARDYTSYLLERGFFEPGYVAFCTAYELCEQ
jgi:hypothetical protein